eukprot:m.426269 g.426269  ORF g.426269 m.426269 type:complete len:481 (+) comp21354_c0_seq5:229-1671(+)
MSSAPPSAAPKVNAVSSAVPSAAPHASTVPSQKPLSLPVSQSAAAVAKPISIQVPNIVPSSASVSSATTTDASRKRKPGEVAPTATVDVKRPAPVAAVVKSAAKSSTSVPPPPGLNLTKATAGGSLPKTGAPHVQSAVPHLNLTKGAPKVPSSTKPPLSKPNTTTSIPLPMPTATKPAVTSAVRAPVVPPSLAAKGVTLPPGAGRVPIGSKPSAAVPKQNNVKIIPGVTTSLVGLRKGAPVVGSKAPTVPKATAPLTVAQSAALKAARARAGTAATAGAKRPSVPVPPGLNLTKQPSTSTTSASGVRASGTTTAGKTTAASTVKALSTKGTAAGKSPLSIPALTTAQVYAQAKMKVAASGSRAASGGSSAASSAAAAAAAKLEADTKGFSKADKRAHHNALERKRRDHIKDSFIVLRDSIPSLQGEKQSSRAQILNKATDYIIQMRKKNQVHQDEMERLKLENEDLDRQTAALLQSNSGL